MSSPSYSLASPPQSGPCRAVEGWAGGAGRDAPSPPPTPTPPPPGTPLSVVIPRIPPATPLPFTQEPGRATAPDGTVIAADSRSLFVGGDRFYPVAGEIHLGRVPSSRWEEELMKMRAGGLNAIAVYVFWIHHEEARGHFTFSGRRDVRRFVTLAKEAGLKVLMRIGPWDHGECRNGGHPDWALTECGQLRTTDPKYFGCVRPWYQVAKKKKLASYARERAGRPRHDR